MIPITSYYIMTSPLISLYPMIFTFYSSIPINIHQYPWKIPLIIIFIKCHDQYSHDLMSTTWISHEYPIGRVWKSPISAHPPPKPDHSHEPREGHWSPWRRRRRFEVLQSDRRHFPPQVPGKSQWSPGISLRNTMIEWNITVSSDNN